MTQTSVSSESPDAAFPADERLRSARTVALVVYALQAASFLLLITFVVGVVINYVKRDDVRGTWLESHFRWQIRTFWYSVLWWVVGAVTVYILVGYPILLAATIWFIYRIVKGWLRLLDDRPMYGESVGEPS